MFKVITEAQKFCEANHIRLTEPRRRVLEILVSNQKPMGAYDILEKLGQYIDNPKPPTAYRAIDFWREHGFVHKIESLNAFIACNDGHSHNDAHFLICDECDYVDEIHVHHEPPHENLNGFQAKRTFTETHGTCEACVK
jgi:Fur family zinc uptake transcriptional regulator